jgi:spore germination protein KB
MNTHLSSRQVGFMAFCLLLGTAVTYMPENSAGRDAWICTLLAIPVGVSILALVIGVQKMFPGRNILEVSQLVMGRSLGLLAYLVYLALLFLMAGISPPVNI